MPDLSDTIKGRRSVRKYQAKAVPKEVIEEVLVAAGWAPSAHNAQPWRFIVLDDPAVKRELAEAMAQAWVADMAKEDAKIDEETRSARVERFANAPVLILACVTTDEMNKFPDAKRQSCERDLAVASLGAALQNLLLTAHAAGLGACWFCAPAFCKDTVRKTLEVPVDVEPQALVAMGYPAEEPTASSRKPFDDIIFENRWATKFR